LIGIAGFILLAFIASFIIFAWYAKDLPSPGKLSQNTGFSTVFYDRDGKILYEMYKDKNRVPVSLKEISKYVQQGTVAVEDKTFYKHNGISETGLIRAFLSTVTRQGVQGGSTLTQQLIKNALLDSERSLPRKIREMILAIEVERRYSKDQILEMYLNEAPYGGTFYGVGSASRGYFGKAPSELSLVESAILSGLPQNPSNFSPYIGTKDLWKGRAKDVLRRMREDKYITQAQQDNAVKALDTVKFNYNQSLAISAPHFVFYAKDIIEEKYGSKVLDQGLKIKTTIKKDIQETAQKIVKEEMAKLKGYNVYNASVVVLDSQTSEILAMVGSKDYFGTSEPDGCISGSNCKFDPFTNVAISQRQPGSTLKPILYSVALAKGYTASTTLMDVSTTFANQGQKDYIPVNYDGKFRGPVQLRFSLGNSLNVPAVKMTAMVGVRDFLELANAMGLKSLAPTESNINRFGLSVSLGGGETSLLTLANAYSVYAKGGIYKDITPITEISDFRGKTIFKNSIPKGQQVMSPEVAFVISHIMSDDNARKDTFGLGSLLNVRGRTVAVKTGTTDDKRDNWAVGFTKGVTVAVWVGNSDNAQMNSKIASGVTGASPIWNRIMKYALDNKYTDGIMDKPNNVEATSIDSFLGGLSKEGYPTRAEYFIKGTEPKDTSQFYRKLKISKNTGKLANELEIKIGQYDEKEFIMITENDPVSTDGKNRWQEAVDEWSRGQGDDKFKPPTETSEASADDVHVQIKSPSERERVSGNTLNIKVKITSISTIKSVSVALNGKEVKKYDGDTKEFEENVSVADGSYDISVNATNEKGKTGNSTLHFGVNQDYAPSPTPTKTPDPTAIPSP